jgi:hypothetical protein
MDSTTNEVFVLSWFGPLWTSVHDGIREGGTPGVDAGLGRKGSYGSAIIRFIYRDPTSF